MTVTYAMLIVFGAFLLIGVATGVVMGRRGHDPWMWGVLGALFGPLVVPLALVRRPSGDHPVDIIVNPGTTAPEGIAVLVGIDGSPESGAAARRQSNCSPNGWARSRSRRSSTWTQWTPSARSAPERACSSARHKGSWTKRQSRSAVPVRRRSSWAVDRRTPSRRTPAANDIDLIAVGAWDGGPSEALLGSVAEQLVRRADVLVLVAGAEASHYRPDLSALPSHPGPSTHVV